MPKSSTTRQTDLSAAQTKALAALVAQLENEADKAIDATLGKNSPLARQMGKTSGRHWDPDAAVARALAESQLSADSKSNAFKAGWRAIWHRNFSHIKKRSPLWPWIIAAAVLATGTVGWIVGVALNAQLLCGYATAFVTAAALGGAGVLCRRRLAGIVPAGWWPWLIGAAADAVVWVGYIAAEGYSALRLTWLLVSTVFFGLRYWSRVRPAYPTGPRAATPDDTTAAARLTELFYQHLACPNGPLAGAEITDLKPYQHGLEGLLRLVPGKHSLDKVKGIMPVICTALGYYEDEIVIEHHRDRRPHELLIRVVTRSPISQTVFFTEPVYADGKILLGPYADGIGNAVFTLYTDDSMECGFILGSKGSGKSRVIEIIALTAIACTPTVVVYIDGQNGASSPLLWKHAHWRGGPEQAPAMLKALREIKEWRQDENVFHGLDGFTPSLDRPGILIIVDESHKIFTQNPDGWAEMSRECRKVGMGILGASQDVTLKAFGGAVGPSDVLRSSLISSNGIALRTASGVQVQVFPGLDAALAKLPKRPGYGYTVDEGDEESDSRGTRETPFRARHLVKESKLAELYAADAALPKKDRTVPKGLRSAEDWFAAVADKQVLDDGSADAAGPTYTNRHAQAEADRVALADRMQRRRDRAQARRHGTPLALPSTPSASPVRTGGWAGAAIPTMPTFPVIGSATTAAAAEDNDLSAAQAKVLTAIAGGAHTASRIAAELDISRQAVHKHLSVLTAAGRVRKTGPRYTPAHH